jgi:hypothetical protein
MTLFVTIVSYQGNNPLVFLAGLIDLPSLRGETLIFRWLKRGKFVNFSKTDEKALLNKNRKTLLADYWQLIT